MKTMRRAIATAAIGIMAASVIGLAAPAASAAPASSTDAGITSIGCEYYVEKARQYADSAHYYASRGMHKEARAAQDSSKHYWKMYNACRWG